MNCHPVQDAVPVSYYGAIQVPPGAMNKKGKTLWSNNSFRVGCDAVGADGCSITDEYIKYARPLIMGELTPVYVNGLPGHILCREVMEYEK